MTEKNTYGQILKSSALIGGSSVLNIGIAVIRTKVLALLLGPAGIGLLGLYGSIADLVQSVAGMGISSSGVRQIAESAASGDHGRIARTASVLQWSSIALGILGALLLLAFARPMSTLTFGGPEQTTAVALLSLAVLLRCVSAGQGAIIQGMRRIRDLAAMGVVSALMGTVISIPIIYVYRESGVVPALIGVAASMLLASWWYSRKVVLEPASPTKAGVKEELGSLLKLGLAFMASGLMTMGVAYAVRAIVLRQVGFEAAGLYQSAWALGGLYVGLILQAMGADFYPRLTAVAADHAECNRTVNEQAQVSLLLAGPGVLATLTLAPLVLAVFYSNRFAGAVGILRWVCLGMTLRVITWPMGYIILARSAQKAFFLSELAWTIVHVGLATVCVNAFGLNGAGIAFFGSYVFHAFMIYPIVRCMSGFRWSPANRKTGLLFLSLIALVFSSFYCLPPWWASGLGLLAVMGSGIYSLRVLTTLVPLGNVPSPLREVIRRISPVLGVVHTEE